MRLALRLAGRGFGMTSPNPMVGAVLVKEGKIIGRGWHRRAGEPHAEIAALEDARRRGNRTPGATLYVTLEPCCTQGRTPPCTDAVIAAGLQRVVVGTTDPNPKHNGRGLDILRRAGVEVELMERERARCARLNEAFNHWIVHRAPFVTVKAAMSLDGKIATGGGDSKWITGTEARAFGMKLRRGSDAILVGINTILADDPLLTPRIPGFKLGPEHPGPRRFVLDCQARTPLHAKVVSDDCAALTTVVVSQMAPKKRVAALKNRVRVLVAPTKKASSDGPTGGRIQLPWLLKWLGSENVRSLLVEGGGEVNASFLMEGLAHRVVFFYAPKILGGRNAPKAVAGEGARRLAQALRLSDLEYGRLGPDLYLTATVTPNRAHESPRGAVPPRS